MTDVQTQSADMSASLPERMPISPIRVDAAHTLGDAPAPRSVASPLPETASEAPWSDSQLAEQMRSQAGQLATHLRAQQQALDRREAQLNAHVAKLENELRTCRMFVRQREEDLDQREQQLGRRLEEVDARQAQLQLEREQFDTECESARQQLRKQTEEIQQRSERLAASDLSEKDFQEAAAHLSARRKHLDQSEETLNKQLAEVGRRRREIEEDRSRLLGEIRRDRQLLAKRERRLRGEVQSKKEALDRQRESLEKREAAVEQMYADVTRMHRESLEMRLATEQLWAELAGRTAPAELTRSIAQVRSRLADQYRLSGSMLARQKEELVEMADRLAEQRKSLQSRQSDLQEWVARRREEIEQQAADLADHRKELEQRESRLRRRQAAWEEQQSGYESEIRRLLAELRRAEPAPSIHD